LIEQLGMLRYGHRPRVGDSFCGGGSIPFEAARLGCDVYASDLNPIACMFTHQDTSVWSGMVGIFWASGLQVVAAWYIATETTSELKKGGYVQGTVILMLRKRQPGERTGFKQRILPPVRAEVQRQIETMMHLNEDVKGKLGEPVFNDSDLQMAGYAAALKVLTAYTRVGGEDVTAFALRPRKRGEGGNGGGRDRAAGRRSGQQPIGA
jgi:adenine-specific DNA methylase